MDQKDTHMIECAERELATFEEKPLSLVDSLVLSWLSYLHESPAFE